MTKIDDVGNEGKNEWPIFLALIPGSLIIRSTELPTQLGMGEFLT